MQCVDNTLNITIHKSWEVIDGITDTVVGDTSLGIVVSTDLSGSVAGGDHGLASRSDIVDIFLVLLVVDLGAQTREGALFVLRLVARLGTLDEYLLHFARIGVAPVVAQTYARLDLVDILSTGTTGAEGLPLDLALVDMHLKLICFGQDCYGSGRGMDASLGLGNGYALYAMDTRFVLEGTIYVLAGDVEDDLLVAAYGTFGEGRNGIVEAAQFEVLGVHTEEVAGKERGLVATGTATNLHDDVLGILRIFGQELEFHFFFQGGYLRFEFVYLGPRHLAQLGVGLVVKDLLGIFQVVDGIFVAFGDSQYLLQGAVLTVETDVTRLIGYDSRVGNE